MTCALLVARLVGLSVAHLLSLGLLMIWCLVPFMPGVCLGFVVRAMFLLSPILNEKTPGRMVMTAIKRRQVKCSCGSS